MSDYQAWADDTAYRMRDFYEANRPLRWWQKRNPPGSWGCVADDLMLGLLNIALNRREREYAEWREAASDRDVLVAENARLREALGMFVSTAVITPETRRVSSDEWVLSKARAALIALAET